MPNEEQIIRCPKKDKKLHKLLRKAILGDKWYPNIDEAMKAFKDKLSQNK